ncbi:FAD-dependent monooxygenase [Actinocorallia sp. A-T 12471]|uniref:FAD-dependent oxidoreductase n=1 Tax=Actinocorallia sp. A-T 12471 TaxID=3089813 RepID=UPI0029CD95E9|nr:FAD-dependent monooxygenase [Actinocorallia sp. A-T 12471]MDX6740786.1 FAD-dependent monooxygenase [Actinocorallia sp. A-T 12471]
MSTPSPVAETEVLIVGAGPAGASAAALLASYGISCVVINKYPGVANTPRAHITNQRAMEVLRDLGLEEKATAASTPQRLMGEHVYATSLSGREFGRLRTWYTHPHFQAEHDLASPCSLCDLPQDQLEPILINAAASRGASVRFNTELVDFTQDADGVTALVADRVTGARYGIRSKYMIGADGGNSLVMEKLGLPLVGAMGGGGSVNIVFEADLTRLVEHRPGDMYWFLQSGAGHDGLGIGVLRMVRPWNRWIGVWGYDEAAGTPELTDEDAVAIAHRLIGDDTIPVKVESVSIWSINHVYATDNMAGRVFCAGDAVHRHPPMNGLGSNTSIQDSYNLCWKLALVLRGQASPALLETYREERVPVAEQIVKRAGASNALIPALFQALDLPAAPDEHSMARAVAALEAPTAEGTERRRAFEKAMHATLIGFNAHGVETNQRYSSRAVLDDGVAEPPASRDEELYYYASTHPGRHIPHVWLTKDQHRVPLFDLCGKGVFTLLIGPRGEAWREAAAKASADLGIPLQVHSIGLGCDYEDSYGDYTALPAITESTALLIRPDHTIAAHPADPETLTATLTALLHPTA